MEYFVGIYESDTEKDDEIGEVPIKLKTNSKSISAVGTHGTSNVLVQAHEINHDPPHLPNQQQVGIHMNMEHNPIKKSMIGVLCDYDVSSEEDSVLECHADFPTSKDTIGSSVVAEYVNVDENENQNHHVMKKMKTNESHSVNCADGEKKKVSSRSHDTTIPKETWHEWLPRPPLSTSPQTTTATTNTSTPFESLILFDKDYVTEATKKYCSQVYSMNNNLQKTRPELEQKLDQMYQTFYGPCTSEIDSHSNNDSSHRQDNETIHPKSRIPVSFSEHLQRQKEFRNPYMFTSIIESFQIDPFGTNLSKSCWDPNNDFAYFEFYDQLCKREEENRIRLAMMEEQT